MAHPKISKTIAKLDPIEDDLDLASELNKLSTSSHSSIQVLVQSLARGDAVLKTDKDGKQFIDYKEKKLPCKRKAHHSQANKIVVPKSDIDVEQKVQACLELIDYVKEAKSPVGVSLDQTKIRLKDGKYREGESFEFTRTKQVLGHGLFGGDIMVVKDNKTEQTHALKTIMISVFRKEEIQCWVNLSDSGHVPSLYLFTMKDNSVDVHMEILQEARTMQSIINEHFNKLDPKLDPELDPELDPALLKPFSLFVLNGSLEAVSAMHGKNWVHNDLHEGNIMLQKSKDKELQIKIIDFGRASKYEDPATGFDHRGFRSDIRNILGMYCSVFSKEEISNYHTTDWAAEIGSQLPAMSDSDRFEVLYLIKLAMAVVQPADVREYRLKVKQELDKTLEKLQRSEMDVLKEVAGILFPQMKQNKHPVDEADGMEGQGQLEVRQQCAVFYKGQGPTIVMEDLLDNLERSMCIGPEGN